MLSKALYLSWVYDETLDEIKRKGCSRETQFFENWTEWILYGCCTKFDHLLWEKKQNIEKYSLEAFWIQLVFYLNLNERPIFCSSII